MGNNTTLKKAIRQAAASIWMDNLPLSKEYVAKYYRKRVLAKCKRYSGPKLTFKRGVSRGTKK